MTDKQTPPDWILIEAAKRSGGDAAENATDWARLYQMTGSYRALCDMIERYEQPPVDRKLLCAREVKAEQYPKNGRQYREIVAGKHDQLFDADFKDMIRAIELSEEGFGK